MKNSRTLFVIASVLVTALILLAKEWEALPHLNSTFFGDYHDALKNYYTVLYHIKWDESYSHFEGMNYPYGEHVLFTDNQPLLSTVLKFVHRHLFPVAGYAVGIINGLMLLSIVLTTLFSHLCLHKLGVNKYLAFFAAIALAFLSPQLTRINAHYALSYSFIIPLLLYQGLLFLEKPRIRRSIYIALIIIAVSFVHAYYFGFGLVIFSGLFVASVFYSDISRKTKIMQLLLQVVLPLIAVQMIMILSDHIGDRPSYPWSPFINNYKPHGIFFPLGKPIGSWINRNFGSPHVEWEGVSYIGAFASLFFLLGALTLPFALFVKKWRKKHPLINPELRMNFILAAGLIAFVIPILYSVLSGDAETFRLMGPLRQFRGVMRFNWVFYFTINFYALTWLSKKIANRKPWARAGFILPVILFLGYDAYQQSKDPYHTGYELDLMMDGSTAQQQMEERLRGYDAMIPVPYFHIGSEDFVHGVPDPEHYRNSMAVSYSAGLPMTAIMLSRTSLEQTLESMTYHMVPVGGVPFARHLKDRQVLLLVQKNQSYSPQEQMLISSGSDTILEEENFYLQEFEVENYLGNYHQARPDRAFTEIDSTGLIVYENYEESKIRAYTGEGSKEIPKEEPRALDTFELELSEGDRLSVGFWVYLYESTKAVESFRFRIIDKEGHELDSQRLRIRENLKALDGKWGYVEFELSPPAEKFVLEISQYPNNLRPSPTFVDGLHILKTEES